MKNKIICVTIFVLLVLSQCFAESAYDPENKPLENFMKIAVGWSADDIKLASELRDQLGNLSETDIPAINVFGQKIWEKYNSDIKNLLTNFENLMADPLPTAIKEPLDKIQDIDHMFCKRVSCALAAVSMFLEADGQSDDAVKLLLLNARFSQFISAGDGVAPSLNYPLFGMSVAKYSLGKALWYVLQSGKVSNPVLKLAAMEYSRMMKEEPAIELMFNSEITSMKNFIQKNLKAQILSDFSGLENESKRSLPFFGIVEKVLKDTGISNPSEAEVDKIVAEMINEIENIWGQSLAIFNKNKSNPSTMSHENSIFMGRLWQSLDKEAKEKMTTWQMVGRTYAAMQTPDLARSWIFALEHKYRFIGAGVLAAVLFEKGQNKENLQALQERAKKRLPKDVFAEPIGPCLTKLNDNILTVYSVGSNGKDDGGDAEKDLILFSISR